MPRTARYARFHVLNLEDTIGTTAVSPDASAAATSH